MKGGGRKKKGREEEEVEELLRATEDDVILKLGVDSHMTSCGILDPDLDARFRALLRPSSHKSSPNHSKPNPMPNNKEEVVGVGEDDLFARFAALKSSLPSSSSSAAANTNDKRGEVDEDEVEKVIRWAMDAARLDPSPISDDDDLTDQEEEEEDSDDDDDDDSGAIINKPPPQ